MAASASSSASVSFTYSIVASSLKVTSGLALRRFREPVLSLGDADHEVGLLPPQPEPVHQGLSDRVAMAKLHGLSARCSACGLNVAAPALTSTATSGLGTGRGRRTARSA